MTISSNQIEQFGRAEWERAKPGRAWSWWLGGASADGRGLRRWQRWIWWTRQQGAQKRALAVARLLRGFVEAPVEVLGGVKHFGDKTAKIHGVSRATQYRQLLMLRWRYGVRPETYYKFQLFKPERLRDAPQFVEEIGQLLQVVCRHSPRTSDEWLFMSKDEFRRWCLAHDIPTVSNLIEVESGKVVSRFVDALPAAELFVKPANWSQGRGSSRWRCEQSASGPCYTDRSGRRFNASEFEEFVCRTSLERGRPYMVQPALMNHPALRRFTNGALATVRLMTVRGSGENSRPLMAALRMPTGDAVADNFALGGVAAPVDLRTGVCRAGIRKKGEYPPDTVDAHPDTGETIPGLTIPFWSECVALVCRAHDLIEAQAPVIGWDVAVLEHGPVIVEPNHLPCEALAQMPGGFPLGTSAFAEIVSARLRKIFLAPPAEAAPRRDVARHASR